MSALIDHMIVAVLVSISVLIVGYSFSPMTAKRWILSRLSRYVGVRAITWLLPKHCGCDDCPTTQIHTRLKSTTNSR